MVVAIVEKYIKSECTDRLLGNKKEVVLERWPLCRRGLYRDVVSH